MLSLLQIKSSSARIPTVLKLGGIENLNCWSRFWSLRTRLAEVNQDKLCIAVSISHLSCHVIQEELVVWIHVGSGERYARVF